MEANELIKYIESPEKLDAESVSKLEALLESYPFFQTPWLLFAKNKALVNTKLDQDELQKVAVNVGDRKKLYFLLHRHFDEDINEETKPLEKAVEMEEAVEKVQSEKVVDTEIVQNEKTAKETLQENISERLNILDHNKERPNVDTQFELITGLSIDIQKEYGEGMNLSDENYALSIREKRNAESKEFFELSGSKHTEENINGKRQNESEGTNDKSIEEQIKSKESGNTDNKENTKTDDEKKEFTEWLDDVDDHNEKEKPSIKENEAPGSVTREYQAYDLEKALEDTANKGDDEGAKNKKDELIDKFIHESPKIKPPSEQNEENRDISEGSVKENEGFITDTLAQIYLDQGNYQKAILAYEKLILKFPEKSTYFANQISKIKKKLNNQ